MAVKGTIKTMLAHNLGNGWTKESVPAERQEPSLVTHTQRGQKSAPSRSGSHRAGCSIADATLGNRGQL